MQLSKHRHQGAQNPRYVVGQQNSINIGLDPEKRTTTTSSPRQPRPRARSTNRKSPPMADSTNNDALVRSEGKPIQPISIHHLHTCARRFETDIFSNCSRGTCTSEAPRLATISLLNSDFKPAPQVQKTPINPSARPEPPRKPHMQPLQELLRSWLGKKSPACTRTHTSTNKPPR